ncbi:MAG TPA: DivIVA domain-containing protein [Streptosporangiales bacterium]
MTTDATVTGNEALAPAALRSARFGQARNGYDRDEVHALLMRAAERIESTDGQCRTLHDEVTRLREENARLRQGGGDDVDEETRMEISVRAVALLSRAQQSADNAVAEAEAYARDLVATAREQYREILQRAQETAAQTTRDLPAVERGEPIPEVEYVRTYARVAQVQLRSVLEALTAEVDKLDRLPRSAPPPPQPVSWQPAIGVTQVDMVATTPRRDR